MSVIKHYQNPDIIKSGAGKHPSSGTFEVSTMCGSGRLYTKGCTESDVKQWKESVSRYFRNEFMPMYERFIEAVDEYDFGGRPEQRQVMDESERLIREYDARISSLTIAKNQPYNYYNSRVHEIVHFWDELALNFDNMNEKLPDELDPGMWNPDDEETDGKGSSGSGSGIEWTTVAGIAGIAGLVFVGYKLWNE